MPNILNNLEVETNFSTLANEEENVQDIGNAQVSNVFFNSNFL
jgi:hypothetical protein